jgi:hypothetical protein
MQALTGAPSNCVDLLVVFSPFFPLFLFRVRYLSCSGLAHSSPFARQDASLQWMSRGLSTQHTYLRTLDPVEWAQCDVREATEEALGALIKVKIDFVSFHFTCCFSRVDETALFDPQ